MISFLSGEGPLVGGVSTLPPIEVKRLIKPMNRIPPLDLAQHDRGGGVAEQAL